MLEGGGFFPREGRKDLPLFLGEILIRFSEESTEGLGTEEEGISEMP